MYYQTVIDKKFYSVLIKPLKGNRGTINMNLFYKILFNNTS